ncbi:iron ABC transporter permease [Sulfurimonas sp. HSL3-7]|uniref:FecCD family ABC transporter permease n=1 Tax=Sulfonitrofixus jiaomeiensis TaxID=3131938 RepID=UPI0031F773C5
MSRTLSISALTGVLVLSMLLALGIGKYPIGLDTWSALLQGTAPDIAGSVVFELRLPRIIAAVLVGAALSVSGAAFQSMFVNPLVSPSLLGVLAGASFGSALGILLSESWFVVQLLTFAFGGIAVLFAMGIALMYRGSGILILVLGGIISTSLFTSLLSVIKYTADPYDQLPSIVYWLMGSFALVERSTLLGVALPMLLGIATLMLLSKYLNVLSMGDDEARALGVNVRWIRIAAITAATLISSLTVVTAGVIGWVGLVIPHIARMAVGPDNRLLIPTSALLGGTYLLLVDTLSRTMFDSEIPIGILTSLVGIPAFVIILRNAKKGWG